MSMLDSFQDDKYNLVVTLLEMELIMNKAFRIILPIILVLVIILCTAWYLFVYDKPFTIDILLSWARYSEAQGNHDASAWFYNLAYAQSDDNDSIAIELANQYIGGGNYTKAEYTLVNAIADGGGIDLYIALSKIYVEQDKLLDAVTMLDQVSNSEIKAKLDAMRPAAPAITPDAGTYREYISVTVMSDAPNFYVTSNNTYPSTENPAENRTVTLVDGVNIISAVAVADNGLVSPLARYEFTVGGVVKEVVFADKAVERQVRQILEISDDEPVYTNQIWTIRDFTMPMDAVNYADLQHFIYLEELVMEDARPQQIYHVKDLVALKTLTISNTNIYTDDLTAIAALPELRQLSLQNCSLSNIDALEAANKLIYLDLSNNAIRDINALRGMSSLTTLNISKNGLTSLRDVASLSKLTELIANNNQIESVDGVFELPKLRILNLSYNKLSDISDLRSCSELTELHVSNNELESVSCLSELVTLLYVDFSFNKVSKLPSLDGCALISINGANNALTNIDNLAVLHQLNMVNMDYNKELRSITALANCYKLIQIDVYGTKVTDVKALTDNGIIVNYKPA